MADPLSPRIRGLKRLVALKTERASWDGRYAQLSQFLQPFSGRFNSTDRNKGNKSFNSILDNTGTRAIRTLAAGMMAGMTSPARPWFRLGVPDDEMMEFGPVKAWLHELQELMLRVFAKSNTYRALHAGYRELGLFGTSCNIVEADYDNVIHNYPLTTGQYCIACDSKGYANTMYREFEMPVHDVVEKFVKPSGQMKKSGSPDWAIASTLIKSLWDAGNYDAWVPILQVIEPRSVNDRDLTSKLAKDMPFKSLYIERDAQPSGGEGLVLRESGYKRFPVLAPRWDVDGDDVYGSSPGVVALGDVKQLQAQQLRKGQAIDFQTLPPLSAPGTLAKEGVRMLPGGVTYRAPGAAADKIESLFEVRLDLNALGQDIMDVRERINSAFYVDMFLMLAQDDRGTPPTAREVAERHEEKLLMLGPVLERLHDELLDPLISLTYDRIQEAGIMPPPPKELQGVDVQVEFISTLAQAQRAVGVQAVDRVLGTVMSMAQVKPDVVDKLNSDRIIDEYADMLGLDPEMIVPADEVEQVRAQRAAQQQEMMKAETAPAAAQTAKTLSETDTQGQNALTDLMNQFQGYTLPQGQA